MKKIVIVVLEEILYYPPTMSLIHVLLHNGHSVTLISRKCEELNEDILLHDNFSYINLNAYTNYSNVFTRLRTRVDEVRELKEVTAAAMKDADILWTCSINTVRDLGEMVLNYKNVLQMMELYRHGYFSKHIKFPLEEIARKSWKNVVPEENRAYIQQAWWQLEKKPYVLPNKPYSLDVGELSDEVNRQLEILKNEKRKVILYLGGIFGDRNFESYARAIQKEKDKYVLYIVGKAYDEAARQRLNRLIEEYGVVYLGYFKAPKHLAFVKNAYIGLLPYRPFYGDRQSELNAVYCAPNKIFEYAGFGIPMIGSDVMGLKNPFEKWNMGVTCNDSNEDEFYNAIKVIDEHYEDMSKNCVDYYNSVNLNEIVENIIAD